MTSNKLQWNLRHVWGHLTENASPCGSLILQTTLTGGTWKRRLSNHNDFWKQKILKFFCKRTNNIHEFEGCVLRGRVRSNAFKSFQRLYSWILNFIGPFAKKILRIFCFQKSLWVDNLSPSAPVRVVGL